MKTEVLETVVKVRLVDHLINIKGVTHRANGIINAICESEPRHRLDGVHNVFTIGWMAKDESTPELALAKFKDFLLNRIYNDVKPGFIFSDNRYESLPKFNI